MSDDFRLKEGSPLTGAGADGGGTGAYGENGSPPLLVVPCSTAPTTSGSFTRNEVWSGTVEIVGDVTVPAGFTVKIEPGTIIKFSNNTGLNIYGKLNAAGTSASPVTFTSISPTPTRGIWRGITFYDSSLDASSLAHIVLEYATNGVWCSSAHPRIENSLFSSNAIAVRLSSSSSSIHGCIIKDSANYGIYLEGGYCDSEIANNQIVRCNNAIFINSAYSKPVIKNNIIRGNAAYGIYIYYYNNPTIGFNTLHGNGTGIYLNILNSYTATISSNIITSNNRGINRNSGACSLGWNDLWENGIDFTGLSAGTSDMAVDPLYEDPMSDDFRLKEGSPLTGAGQDGGGLGAYGENGSPPLLVVPFSTTPTTSGSLTSSEVWSGTVEIAGDVTVPVGFTLKIDPGAIIHFSNNTGLNIQGRLEAAGTPALPVTFTSASSAPTKGIWKGITFSDSSLDASSLTHIVMEYAANGVWCSSAHPRIESSVFSSNAIAIRLSSSSSSIHGCIIKDSANYGIYLEGSDCDSEIADNQIVRCNNAIFINAIYSKPVIKNNIIRGNAAYGIYIYYYNTPTISFNTLYGNGTAIYINILNNYSATISSNIISSNNCGINRISGTCNLSWNDLWENETDYSGLSAGASDLSVDPLFIDALSEDFSLREGSSLLVAGEDGKGIGAYGENGSPPLLILYSSSVPTTSGSLTSNEVWSGTVEIAGDVTVPFGFTLKIEPGAIIRFSNNTGLNVQGRLEAAGTPTLPVTFTSASSAPTKGIWKGIVFSDSSLDTSSLVHIAMEYAANGVWCSSAHPRIENSLFSSNAIAIRLSSTSSSIHGCTIKDSSNYGIYIEGSYCDSEIADNQIVRCNNAIFINAIYSKPVIKNNIIRGNAAYGIYIYYYNTPTIGFNTLYGNGTAIYINILNNYSATISSRACYALLSPSMLQ